MIEDGTYDPPPMHLLGPPTCPCSSNDSSLSPAPAILKPNSSCSDNNRGPEAGLVRERPKVLNIVPHSKPVIKPSIVTNSLRGGVSSGMFHYQLSVKSTEILEILWSIDPLFIYLDHS